MLSMTAPTLWLISFNGSFKWAPFKGGFRIPSQSVHIYIIYYAMRPQKTILTMVLGTWSIIVAYMNPLGMV